MFMTSCDGFSTVGKPYEGKTCNGVSKVFASPLKFTLTISCLYGEKCITNFSYWGVFRSDTLSGKCFSEYELNIKINDSLMVVNSQKKYPLPLASDTRALFSLVDENNIEKRYDIDLSGIVNSYMVRGDSVDVNVMKHCSLSLYSCDRETVYGNLMLDSRYSFSILDGCKEYFSYDCSWHNQGSLEVDDLDIHAEIYWKK